MTVGRLPPPHYHTGVTCRFFGTGFLRTFPSSVTFFTRWTLNIPGRDCGGPNLPFCTPICTTTSPYPLWRLRLLDCVAGRSRFAHLPIGYRFPPTGSPSTPPFLRRIRLPQPRTFPATPCRTTPPLPYYHRTTCCRCPISHDHGTPLDMHYQHAHGWFTGACGRMAFPPGVVISRRLPITLRAFFRTLRVTRTYHKQLHQVRRTLPRCDACATTYNTLLARRLDFYTAACTHPVALVLHNAAVDNRLVVYGCHYAAPTVNFPLPRLLPAARTPTVLPWTTTFARARWFPHHIPTRTLLRYALLALPLRTTSGTGLTRLRQAAAGLLSLNTPLPFTNRLHSCTYLH